MECSIQRSEAKLRRTFHFSWKESICSIRRMKNIHYFFYITSNYFCYFQHFINIEILENANSIFIALGQFKGHRGAPLNVEL